jgi:hypothetical protein
MDKDIIMREDRLSAIKKVSFHSIKVQNENKI